MGNRVGFSSTSTVYQLPQLITFPNTVGYFLEKYAPTTPKENADGSYEPVTESIDLVFFGTTVTIMRENINRVELFLKMARDRALREAGVRYYMTFHLDGDLAGYRSGLISGRLELAADVLTAYGQAQMRGRVIVTRQPYWESSLRTEVRIGTYQDPAQGTGGRRIKNYRDGAAGNYVTVDNSSVTGVMPTPAQVSLQNTSGASQGYRNWYIANNVWSDPLGFNQVLEGENRRPGYGTVVPFASSSNGQYVQLAVNTTSSIIWDMSGALTGRCGGQTFRLLMRLASVPVGNIYVTPGIWDTSGNVPLTPFRKEIAITSTSSRLVDLGTMQIPPGLGNSVNQADTTLRFDVRSDSSTLLNIDYVQLFPTTGLRHLAQRGNLIPNNDFVVDDGIEGMAYSDETDSSGNLGKHAIYAQLESPVLLWPGRHQRLYFLHDTDGSDAPIATQTTVRMWYRARTMTI